MNLIKAYWLLKKGVCLSSPPGETSTRFWYEGNAINLIKVEPSEDGPGDEYSHYIARTPLEGLEWLQDELDKTGLVIG